MTSFQRLVIRALAILIRNMYTPSIPVDASIEQRLALMDDRWKVEYPKIQAWEADAQAVLDLDEDLRK